VKELQEIVIAFDRAQQAGKLTALATVVHVDGSSYRRPGARMLVTDDGELTGAISGGCLEGDALRKARLVMAKQTSLLVTYDTTDDDDAKFGVGLGCNGIIHILIEPINADHEHNPIAFFKRFLSSREPVVMVTIFDMNNRQSPQYGTCLLVDQQGGSIGVLPDSAVSEVILFDAAQVLKNANTASNKYHYYDSFTCMIELLQPALSLVIVGAGNDAIPLVQMATVLGWQTTIVDGRTNYATVERFPSAGKVIVAKPNEVISRVAIDARTVFMLMTHNYNYDVALLSALLGFPLPYIGVLGPKKRLMRILDEIMSEPTIPDNLYGPAGLDIGSENAEEIALAIVSEIQSVLNKRKGESLRTKQVIHDRHLIGNCRVRRLKP
jgi:xanthine dehydrogenase accessory factor